MSKNYFVGQTRTVRRSKSRNVRDLLRRTQVAEHTEYIVNRFMVIVLGTTWKGIDIEILRALLGSVADELAPYLRLTDKKVTVVHWEGPHPMIVRGQDLILLTAGDNYWCQYAYQFAHELCHFATRRERLNQCRSFFVDEVLCEAASIFVLQRLAVSWRTHANPIFQHFAAQHELYVRDWLANVVPASPVVPPNFHPINNSYDRPLAALCASKIQHLFAGAPESWEATLLLPHPREDLGCFMNEWAAAVMHQPIGAYLVSTVRRVFESAGILASGENGA